MDTGKPTPRALFALPVQYAVPLFQRAYVWNHQYHWEPLWDDIRDTAVRSLDPGNPPLHFLGAIVLKQLPVLPGEPSRYLIVDGQQRLTTLQLALAAFRDALSERSSAAHQNELNFIRTLTENPNLLQGQDRQKYKIVPFNDADIEAFEAIIDQRSAPDPNHPMTECHAYYQGTFAATIAKAESEPRVSSLIRAVGDLLQIVSVNLDANENEHLIFETLNARAEPLSEWDKARNLFFAEASASYEKATEQSFYDQYIRQFDAGEWWNEEVWAQRWWGKRVGIFLRHWLEVEHKEAIPHHRVYYWFRRLVRSRQDIRAVAGSFVHYGKLFREVETPPEKMESVEGRFFYRRSVLGVGVAVPLLMELYGRLEAGAERDKCLIAIESWLVRRLLSGYNARGYDKFFMKLLQGMDAADDPSGIVSGLLSDLQEGYTWPEDHQVQSDVIARAMYPWHAQRRVRMVLEAIEARLIAESGMAGNPAVPKELWIEHVMPQSWQDHWPLPAEAAAAREDRERAILTLGNLTLTNSKLDIRLSNRPWEEKQRLLRKHDNLFLNKELLQNVGESEWNEEAIRQRGRRLAGYILQIWPHASAL